jgi:hypothetical protein
MTRTQAIERLIARYDALVIQYPRLARIPRERYVTRNLRGAMKLTIDADLWKVGA